MPACWNPEERQVPLLPRHLGYFVNGEARFPELVVDSRRINIYREVPYDVPVELLVLDVVNENPNSVGVRGRKDKITSSSFSSLGTFLRYLKLDLTGPLPQWSSLAR